MESELERFHKQNTNLELNIEELKLKLKATEKEMYQERQKVLKLSPFFLKGRIFYYTAIGFRGLVTSGNLAADIDDRSFTQSKCLFCKFAPKDVIHSKYFSVAPEYIFMYVYLK